ncbi:hypothetical protein ACVGVM_04535 [Pseudonocardia bannensis]|uniref:Uncharacterized protein n=1 Tax=Pseudonocardia bannensis TaxID=630973 RepID=A0A848DM77_9PSEU|nr:hypothetical protein [Pseudonocardia bannensis]NMH93867.1 hypothetical protein [Pseudonocardia bannensis]
MTSRWRNVAFGQRPGDPVTVTAGSSPNDRWLAAVALGGQGRYAAAAALLHGLLGDRSVRPDLAAHAAVTLAAHRRQLGGHAAARRWDGLGLRLAEAARRAGAPARPEPDGVDAAGARIDALVGLAADAVGTAQAGLAEWLLAAAAEAAREHPSWRPAVRLGWVRAELSLIRGEPAAAIGPAEHAVAAAAAAGSARHLLKSRIVAAVVRAAADPDDAAAAGALADLDALAAEAERLSLPPLRWPAELAAADLADRLGVRSSAGHARRSDAHRTAEPANDRAGGRCGEAPNDTLSDTPRRRHAAAATLRVIYRNADPVGRRLMGESAWVPEWLGVM